MQVNGLLSCQVGVDRVRVSNCFSDVLMVHRVSGQLLDRYRFSTSGSYLTCQFEC
jgi:hypothetical protein